MAHQWVFLLLIYKFRKWWDPLIRRAGVTIIKRLTTGYIGNDTMPMITLSQKLGLLGKGPSKSLMKSSTCHMIPLGI